MSDTGAAPGPEAGIRGPVDRERVSLAIRELLAAIGEDPDREGLVRTPADGVDVRRAVRPGR